MIMVQDILVSMKKFMQDAVNDPVTQNIKSSYTLNLEISDKFDCDLTNASKIQFISEAVASIVLGTANASRVSTLAQNYINTLTKEMANTLIYHFEELCKDLGVHFD